MLHHPVPESTARPLLEQVKALQDALFLGIVALPSAHTWADNNALAAWVEVLPHWRNIPIVVRDRFGRINSSWSTQVKAIARASVATKAEMRRVWDSHQQVSALYSPGSAVAVEMPDWDHSVEWSNLRDLMSSFYDKTLGSADFPLPSAQKISGDSYQSGYSVLNVCPYWDCGLVNSEIELDHFLPRGSFPFLSVDPDNLVPVSHGPNRSGHKGAKVSLDNRPTGQPRSATEWFHPRWRSADGNLDAQVARPSGAALRVALVSTSPAYQQHVANLDWLLDLSGYWTEEANSTFKSDLSDVGQEVKDYAPGATVENVLARRIRNHANRSLPRPHALLNQRKFECFLADQSTRDEISRQSDEVGAPLRPV